ncbi:hypothetical protein [Streptomyces sp. NRRL F-2890]|uniref:hypothetical protein n=1 Tax=Streptomyces sp. NRRL F-2890 TaxID=1463845 RepID=UPI00131A4B02|nr:hypothetical protein [Streptomyces sp. NRRL F-2890]
MAWYVNSGFEEVTFKFPAEKGTTRTQTLALNPEKNVQNGFAVLSGFDLCYTNKNQFQYGDLKIDLKLNGDAASITCSVALRDGSDGREWSGWVKAVAVYLA